MATQFVKWWKTKFHATSGCTYKNISVLGSDTSDGRPSDTEDLVRDDTSSSCNNGAHVNAGLAPSESSEHSHDHPEFLSNEVKFEDFECDVHVEGSESGEERKEFSFTFYDLDGHGKITKDDIAGLVRSIYGAVNDSITVPQGGKKTIKVRLTVTPENKQASNSSNNQSSNKNNNLSPGEMGNGNSSPANGRPKLRNNVNVTIQENLNRERGSGRRDNKDRYSHVEKPKFNSVRLPNSAHAGCRGCRNLSPEVFRDCSASPLRNRKKWRERACSLQRPDLFELLQANMEKNNVSPCCRHDHAQHHQHSSVPCTHNHLIDPTCPVLPLVNENLCKQKVMDQPHLCSRVPVGLGAKVYDSQAHRVIPGQLHHQCKKHGHHRSRSHDLSQNLFRYHLLSERDQLLTQPSSLAIPSQPCCNQLNTNTLHHHHEESVEILGGCILSQHLSPRNKNTNLVNTTAASPHQLKHRNREQEHARAMAQVISWLERENIGEKKFSSPRKNPNPSNPLPGSPPVVKKHEHHHVHEHVHHHYHHYSKETPIIV